MCASNCPHCQADVELPICWTGGVKTQLERFAILLLWTVSFAQSFAGAMRSGDEKWITIEFVENHWPIIQLFDSNGEVHMVGSFE